MDNRRYLPTSVAARPRSRIAHENQGDAHKIIRLHPSIRETYNFRMSRKLQSNAKGNDVDVV